MGGKCDCCGRIREGRLGAEGGVNPKQLLRLEGRGEGGKVINKSVGRRTGRGGGAIPDTLVLSVK